MKIAHWYKKFKRERWMFRSLFHTLYFNFHYLPFKQAVRLPVVLYKPKFLSLRGKVIIDAPAIRPGMIQLGNRQVSLYPDSGIIYDNQGGTIVFKGRCYIGNASALSVGAQGKATFGDRFTATTAFKLVSCCGITFENDVLCGWECLFMDTDFHQLTSVTEAAAPKPYGKIHIGQGCWFALKSTVMKGTVVPACCVVGAHSFLNKSYANLPPYSLLAGQPATLRKTGICLDRTKDRITYGE